MKKIHSLRFSDAVWGRITELQKAWGLRSAAAVIERLVSVEESLPAQVQAALDATPAIRKVHPAKPEPPPTVQPASKFFNHAKLGNRENLQPIKGGMVKK